MVKRNASGTARRLRQTSVRLDQRDRLAAKRIIAAGWARNTAGAIRYALKVAADQIAA